jgi:hypothetical protein
MNKKPNPLQMIAALLIDFFRWSQLTPMILMWAFMLGMLFALFFVNNQEATFTMVQRVTEWVASLPVIGPRFVSWAESHSRDGVLDFNPGAIDFKSAVLKAWGIISLIFMALGWLAGRVFGPFNPWTLKRKLGVAVLSSLFVVAVFMGLYFLDRETWNDPLSSVLLSASGMALVLLVVSTWCLSVSHLLGWLSGAVAETDFSKTESGGGVA